MQKQNTCFYCKRFFCTGYISPRNRALCSGVLPQWEWLYFLMKEVRATGTCKRFVLHERYKQNQK